MAVTRNTSKSRATAHQVGTPAESDPEENYTDSDVTAPKISVLEAFKQALKDEDAQGAEPYRLTVPERKDIKLLFDTTFDYETYQAWINKATDKKNKEINYWRLAVMVISNTNTGIEFGDEEVPGMTITSHDLHGFLSVPMGSVASAVHELFKKDGHAIQAMKMVVEKAGYTMDGDVQEADDTPLDG